MKRAIGIAFVLIGSGQAMAQPAGISPEVMMTPEYMKAADAASASYKACLRTYAQPMAAHNKTTSLDLIIRAAKTKCQKEDGILAMYRGNGIDKIVEDKVMAELLDHR